MKHLLITLLLLLSFTACQDKKTNAEEQAAHDAKIAAQARAEVFAEIKAEEEAKIEQQLVTEKSHQRTQLNQMGVAMKNGTISIDINKGNDYFSEMGNKMQMQMQKVSDDLQRGIIDSKEAGIEITKEHINIDLNKTKNLLEEWSKKIELFAHEFDKITTPDTNTSNIH